MDQTVPDKTLSAIGAVPSDANHEEQTYIEQARYWHAHHWQEFQKSQRRLMFIIVLLLILLALSVATWAICLPLKRVEPYLVRVDSTSGRVDVIPTFTPAEPMPLSVTRHLVQEYVQSRERYIAALAEADYVQVGAWQSAQLNEQWASEWARSNPRSPLNVYAGGAQVFAEINTISFLKDTPPYLVQVRFKRRESVQATDAGTTQNYIATLRADFKGVAADPTVRALNPLGFKVVEYRREPEVSESERIKQEPVHER
jgi:type IV secretion system protein VirB8